MDHHPPGSGNEQQAPFYQYDPSYSAVLMQQQQQQTTHQQSHFTGGQNGMIQSPPIFHYSNQPSTNHPFQQNFQSFQHRNQPPIHPHSRFPNYPVNYQYNAMQSPPLSVGSPNQPFSNLSNGSVNPALSPGNMGSPMGYSNGSPIVRMTPDNSQRSSSVVHEVRSPPPANNQSMSLSSLSLPSPGSVHSSGATPVSHLDYSFQSPQSVTTNGPLSVSSPPKSVEPPPSPIIPVEEPLPQYPSPEELERMASQARPMIPEAMISKIFAKAGVSFLDPKIGSLITLSSQHLINEIVQDALSSSKDQGKPQNILTHEGLEKALQDRGARQFPTLPTDISI